MKLRYREDKATQAAALLLDLGGGKLNLMKLIKLLYFAERRAVLEWGRPITFDEFWSLKHGPVLSATLDNINSGPLPNEESYWLRYVSPRGRDFDVCLVTSDVPNDQLSRAEERVLRATFADFGHLDQWQLRDYAHNNFPEWKDPGNSRFPIQIRDILLAEGYSKDDAEEIEYDLRGETIANSLDFA
jgi:uncharacterized phage-associated protein